MAMYTLCAAYDLGIEKHSDSTSMPAIEFDPKPAWLAAAINKPGRAGCICMPQFPE